MKVTRGPVLLISQSTLLYTAELMVDGARVQIQGTSRGQVEALAKLFEVAAGWATISGTDAGPC